MEENMTIYNKYHDVPKEAQKQITGGRLNGMTNINPMWRIKVLTEEFGPCGKGWYYDIVDISFVPGANNEISCFVKINLFVKIGGEWSMPIVGIGGSMFVVNEKKGLYQNDEAQKNALTDAISVSCKALGIGSSIYWKEQWDSKYDNPPTGNDEPDKRIVLTMDMNKNIQNCIKALSSGAFTISDIEKKYKLSEEMKEYLMNSSI